MLRQWYVKYHPDSGPLRISSADELESLLGEDLRTYYGDLKARALHTALRQRVKPVLVVLMVVRIWIEQYRPEVVSRQRSAGVVVLQKIEYQGRETEHSHIACWVLAHCLLRYLAGNKKTVKVMT